MHVTTPPARGKGNQEGCLKSEVLQQAFPKGLVRGKVKSQEDQEEEEVLQGDLASTRAAPLTRSQRSWSSEKEGPPSCWKVMQTAAGCTLTVDAEKPLLHDGKAKKFAKSYVERLWRGTEWEAHHLTQLSRCTEYTPCVPWQWACFKRSMEEEPPPEDSESSTEARREGTAPLGFRVEPLTWAAEETEGPPEAWWLEHGRGGEALETRPGLASDGSLECL